jgi:hypothetical protein
MTGPVYITDHEDRKRWRGDIVHLEADRRPPIGYVTGLLVNRRPGAWSVILGSRR